MPEGRPEDYGKPGMPPAPSGGPDAGMPPEGAPGPQGPEKGKVGPQEAMGAIKTIQDAMSQISAAMGEAGAPPEAIEALNQAQQAYGKFVSMITGGAEQGAPKGPQGPGEPMPAETAGAAGSPVPEDQAMMPKR